MLYVTCTLSKDENEDVVQDILAENQGMTAMNLKHHVPPWGIDLIDEQGYLKTLPHIHGMEGFFGALLSKKTK